jgi:hypothetical protein
MQCIDVEFLRAADDSERSRRVELHTRDRRERQRLVLDELELIAPRVEDVLKAQSGGRPFRQECRTGENTQALLGEVRARRFDVLDLERDVMPAEVAVAWLDAARIRRPLVVKELEQRILRQASCGTARAARSP